MARPLGAENRNKRMRAAISRVFAMHPDKEDALALKMIEKGIEGDVAAATWVRDTHDGKPPQAHTGDDDSPPIRMHHQIERVIVDSAQDTNSESVSAAVEPGEI